jgi:hypothetical protein
MNLISKVLLNAAVRSVLVLASQLLAQMPTAIAASDGAEIVTLHAEGAQIYECKPEPGNKPKGHALRGSFANPWPRSSWTENPLGGITLDRIGITPMEAE